MDWRPQVARLLIYPIKSLDGVAVDAVSVLASGALKGDREFALVDGAGNMVNGKRHSRIHALRAEFELATGGVSLTVGDAKANHFQIDTQRDGMEHWFSKYFGFPVQIQQDQQMGFPDDRVSPGPTIVSTATLEAIAAWYPEMTVDEVRRRFRSNIEISGVPAFWEDQLFSTTEAPVPFQIGAVQLLGMNPCQRCVVVTRNPDTGEATPSFQKEFVARRQESFPEWAARSRFNHFFRLAVNTQIPSSEAEKTIRLGDQVLLN